MDKIKNLLAAAVVATEHNERLAKRKANPKRWVRIIKDGNGNLVSTLSIGMTTATYRRILAKNEDELNRFKQSDELTLIIT